MKRLGAALVFFCLAASAYAVQEVTLKDVPPLQPIHYCKHSDGNIQPQNGPCDSGDTDVGDAKAELQPDGHTIIYHEAPQQAAPMETNRPTVFASSPILNQDDHAPKMTLLEGWKHIGKWLLFAIVIGVLAKFTNRSFFLWLIIGFVLRAVLVAVNVMAF